MSEKTMVTVQMTEEELKAFQAHKEEQERKELAKRTKEDRAAYQRLVEEEVDKHMPRIIELNKVMRGAKNDVFEGFRELIDTKGDLYQVDNKQRSHTFRNADSTSRITIGYHKRDAWLDTVREGIEMVKDYLSSLAKDKDSERLVSMLLDLLVEDSQGNLQADKVLELSKHAEESDSDLFKEGVDIIKKAYCPELSKRFIRAEVKGQDGKWVNIPLSMTEV